MRKKFIKTIEDFVCDNCTAHVCGNGYTNHCPRCLFSKHVDIHPGDRAALCGGLMEPSEVTQKNGTYVILHRCMVCRYEKKNVVSPEDDTDALLKIFNNQTRTLFSS